MTTDFHPSFRARLMRSLRGFTNLRGWRRGATAFAGSGGDFRVVNQGRWIEGSMSSLIERQSYLFGGYERDQIDLFLSIVPADRRGTILDIGANVGTHSLRFSTAFDRVVSFEPNPLVIDRLRRNVALNPDANIQVHNVGLGDAKGEFDLFAPSGANQGLGTFLTDEQYDRPLEKVGVARIKVGDDYVAEHAPGRIAAIKCDVQGFEAQVFRGLHATVARDRPVLWIEIGSGAHTVAEEIAALIPLLPAPARYFRMASINLGPVMRATLIEAQQSELDAGDWVIVPQ